MTAKLERGFRACPVCGVFMVFRQRVTRSTYVCPHTADWAHVNHRREARYYAREARIAAAGCLADFGHLPHSATSD